jgi:acyl dehydratase
MITINNFEEYKSLEGVMVGNSSWHIIDQKQINQFADATLDHQWIHVDPNKAEMKVPISQQLRMAI